MNSETERLFQQNYENLIKILKEFINQGKLKDVLVGKDKYSTYKYYQPLYGMAFNDAGQTDVKLLFSIFHDFIKEAILNREQITDSLIEASKEEVDYLFIYLFIYLFDYLKNEQTDHEKGDIGYLNKKRDIILDWKKLVSYINETYLDKGIKIFDKLYFSNNGMKKFNDWDLGIKFNI